MGDQKFIPNMDVDTFEKIVTSCKAYQTSNKEMAFLWSNCKGSLYNLTERTKNLGFANDGVTTYFSENCTEEDSDLVNEWLKEKKLDAYNCRTFKTIHDGHTSYEIRMASYHSGEYSDVTTAPEEFKGCTFSVTRGDYSELMEHILKYLNCAKCHTKNGTQQNMIDDYILSFQDGDLELHKEGSR